MHLFFFFFGIGKVMRLSKPSSNVALDCLLWTGYYGAKIVFSTQGFKSITGCVGY